MKTILYLNHVCWEWIMQRPQIIALLLEKDYDVTVVNKKFIFGKKTSRNNKRPLKEKIVYLLPKGDKFQIIYKFNALIYKISLKELNRYDAVWICHPELYKYIPEQYNGKIIYDCMDNHVAMSSRNKNIVKNYEEQLIERANLILVSSERLLKKIGHKEKTILIRNGFQLEKKQYALKKPIIKKKYKIGYFGTISSWFDFNILEESIKQLGNIEYKLIGPIEDSVSSEVEKCSNFINYVGIVEHETLGLIIEDLDALFMPFIVNDIILYVDPVKLYEYIQFGKCIISSYYPEIERFRPYVYFYKNKTEYIDLLKKLSALGFPPKYTDKDRECFLIENTWDYRYKILKKSLESI